MNFIKKLKIKKSRVVKILFNYDNKNMVIFAGRCSGVVSREKLNKVKRQILERKFK